MSAWGWAAFLAAGAVGAPLRHLVAGVVGGRAGGASPWGIFAVNVAGSFLLGLVVGLEAHRGLDGSVVLVAGTGFCGSFTTFSTFAFQSVRLVETGAAGRALLNAAATLLAGGAAAALGLAVASL